MISSPVLLDYFSGSLFSIPMIVSVAMDIVDIHARDIHSEIKESLLAVFENADINENTIVLHNDSEMTILDAVMSEIIPQIQ